MIQSICQSSPEMDVGQTGSAVLSPVKHIWAAIRNLFWVVLERGPRPNRIESLFNDDVPKMVLGLTSQFEPLRASAEVG